MLTLGVGCLDAQSMIEMNNLSVGYRPEATSQVGVYPPAEPPSVSLPVPPPKAPSEVEQLGSQTKS